jgi:predicted extracellular nuclease
LGTPGAENTCVATVTLVKIHEVQGAGAASPLVGQTVAIEGIVVGDFQDDVGANGDLNGFFVQEEDADADTDPATSEGVFVFQGSNPTVDVAIGDHVRVEGSVSEYFGDTQITSFSGVTVNSSGNPLPTVSVLSMPVAQLDDFEAYEGMYVTFPQTLFIAEFFNFDRFGEIVLTTERQFQATATYEPGSAEAANLIVANSLARITLDDGRTNQNPDPAIHPNGLEFNLDNLFRGGDTVENVTGVINYAFGRYRIQPTQGADYTNANPRTLDHDPVGGNLKVASFNVLNYFTTLDNSSCPYSAGCRGADNAEEFTRQRDKIIAAIAEMDADVVGLIEIENHPDDVPTADLVSGLNDVMGAGTYEYVATGAIGTDAIRQAFIYKPDSVSLVGSFAVLDDPSFTDPLGYGEAKSRPALAQTFVVNDTGGVFTAVVNHLKSKGSSCGPGDDDPQAASCNLTRTLGAQALVSWLATDPTGSGDEDFLIIGDLNAYDKEDPIDALIAGGYADLVYHFVGEDAYSYVFDGQLGYLDHALSIAELTDEVTGTTIWHINSDEPDLIDYDTSFKRPAQDAIYAPDAFRSSDHDPVIVGLELTTEAEILELIEDIHELVDDGVLNEGQGNSFMSKLENTLDKLAKGQTKAAANQLGAFINEVEDFVAEGILTAEQGDSLIKAAALLVDALN